MIIGGGITGLSAAVELARMDLNVTIIEKSGRLGGYAARLTCKATDQCVKCGACKVDEKIRMTRAHPNITLHLNQTVFRTDHEKSITVYHQDQKGDEWTTRADAIMIATGFQPYNPVTKPYGYRQFANVVTSLELEKIIKENSLPQRPSDGKTPGNIAFIQCVGSRDAGLNHLWCSKFCCPSSLRMARLIKSRDPETDITVFYIDFQNCGKNHQAFQSSLGKHVRRIRSIPGDIFKTPDDRLELSFFDPARNKALEEKFDLVVLSVGISPNPESESLSKLLKIDLTDSGFINTHEKTGMTTRNGVFAAGTANGPMTIEESFSSGTSTACKIIEYLANENK